MGIDTDLWRPAPEVNKEFEFLIYDKVRWEHDRYEKELIEPIRSELRSQGLRFSEIRYGHYKEDEYHSTLKRCKAMIFLCEHETQGIAYQQALSMDIPILAWDRGGYWQDPSYFPKKVRYEPVSSVPYWNQESGVRFQGVEEFPEKLKEFLQQVTERKMHPRKFILENLTLKKAAEQYLGHMKTISS